jgi:hypothetical protein
MGCLERTVLDAQFASIRGDEGGALGTLHDFEISEDIGFAAMGQLEVMQKLAPDSEDALFVLTRGWAGVTLAFTQDAWEQAMQRGDLTDAEYQMHRTRAGFERSLFFGEKWLDRIAPGFDAAQKDAKTLKAWLDQNFSSGPYAEELSWLGFSWVSRVASATEDAEVVAGLWVGIALTERSIKLDERASNGMSLNLLGAFYADSQPEKSKEYLDRAMAIGGPGYLPPILTLATSYHCAKRDRTAYEATLRGLVEAPDQQPIFRFLNLLAKRRAHRYLTYPVFQERCAFDAPGAAPGSLFGGG